MEHLEASRREAELSRVSNPQVGRSTSHRIFPFFTARRTLNGSSISLSGNLHPQQSSRDPLFTLGRSDFATSRGQWSSVGLSNPRNPTTVNADLSLSFRDFPIAISALAMSNNLFPDSRIPICRNSDTRASLTFQRLHSIGISEFAISRILMQLFRDFSPRNPEMVCHLSTH
jgi:hypothetical protein